MLTLASYIAGVRSGELNAKDILQQYQDKASKNELNAWITLTPEYSENHFDEFLARPLCGAPIGVKDIIMTKGCRTTCGSRMLENYIPEYSASCFLNLEKAGGLMIGKTAMDEFALGSSGEHCAYGPSKNPHDQIRVPGGTSSGSAASVANDECLAALGTDTGGSCRQPAAFCGIVGFKPSYGNISRYGVQAAANSLDQVGVLTKTVTDAWILYNALAGYDSLDMNSIQTNSENGLMTSEDFEVPKPGKPLKACVFNEFFGEGIDPQIKDLTLARITELQSEGVSVEFVNFPLLEYLIAVYYIINPAEVSTNLARFDGIRYGMQNDTTLFESLSDYYKYIRSNGFGQEVKRRLLIGSYVLSAGHQDQYYNKAIAARDHIKQEYMKLFEEYDVIIGPMSPERPRVIGQHANDPLADYLVDIYSVPPNLIGAPAMSVPIGFGEVEGKKLPLGLHIMAKPGDDEKVFQMGMVVERLKS